MKYKVKLTYKYSDTVFVEADNKEDAIQMAIPLAEELYESFYDAEATEEQE